jgi:hypothetical protein
MQREGSELGGLATFAVHVVECRRCSVYLYASTALSIFFSDSRWRCVVVVEEGWWRGEGRCLRVGRPCPKQTRATRGNDIDSTSKSSINLINLPIFATSHQSLHFGDIFANRREASTHIVRFTRQSDEVSALHDTAQHGCCLAETSSYPTEAAPEQYGVSPSYINSE